MGTTREAIDLNVLPKAARAELLQSAQKESQSDAHAGKPAEFGTVQL